MTAEASQLKVIIPDAARRSCQNDAAPLPPAPPLNASEADYAAFGRLQTGALEICDRRRALGVAAGDLHNLYVDRLAETLRPPTLGERLTGRRRKAPPAPTLDDLEQAVE